MNSSSLPELPDLIALIKAAAQQELVPRFARIKQHFKDDGSIITEADRAMQAALHEQFQTRWPDIAFLGEEMPAAEQTRILAEARNGVWVVDPLDGTSNFSLGIPFFAVSIALVSSGVIRLAVVYDPLRDECFSAQQDEGAYLNGERLDLRRCMHVRHMSTGLVDFKRLPKSLAVKLATEPPYKSQRSFGSVALDWCWLAAARGDVYVHGKQNLWDYVAGQLILSEAGGYAATLQGEPVFNGTLKPRSAVLAVNEHLFESWLAYLQAGAGIEMNKP